ncbi:MAG: hypothetical protein KA230_13935 [Flavobacteriales bacterium]|nr:hypothetical protein [Flavobacteriales bacterium]
MGPSEETTSWPTFQGWLAGRDHAFFLYSYCAEAQEGSEGGPALLFTT